MGTGQTCTKTFFHERSIMHEGSFLQIEEKTGYRPWVKVWVNSNKKITKQEKKCYRPRVRSNSDSKN